VPGHREIQPAPREQGLLPLLRALVRLQPQMPGTLVPGRLDQALARLDRLAHPGSLVFLLSDFRELGEGADKHLAALARHNDVIAAFLYDPLEAEAPPAARYRLGSGSARLLLDTGQRAVAQQWASQFQAHREGLRALCRRHRIHFMAASTSDRPLQALRYGLARHGRGEI